MATGNDEKTRRRLLSRGLARALQAPLEAPRGPLVAADAIVVLGAPCAPSGALSALGKERVEAGVDLWRRELGRLICFTGHRGEAQSMADHAMASGVPEHAVRIEPQAKNTRENARRSAALLLAEGCRTVWVVSQPFHLKRAVRLFEARGLTALPWHAEDSLQFRRPRHAVSWLVREYAAWAYWAVSSTRES